MIFPNRVRRVLVRVRAIIRMRRARVCRVPAVVSVEARVRAIIRMQQLRVCRVPAVVVGERAVAVQASAPMKGAQRAEVDAEETVQIRP